MNDMESVLPFVNENSYHNFCTEIIISSQQQAPENDQSAHDFCDHFLNFHDKVLNPLIVDRLYNNGTHYQNINPSILQDYFYSSERLNNIIDVLNRNYDFSYFENVLNFNIQIGAYRYANEGMMQLANIENY